MPFRLINLVLCVIMAGSVQAQVAYPRHYFRNPLDIPMELAANFGELRTNHWHMGLDIRTKQKENLPIYAAAAGYIAYIGIRPESFGRFIIINHPNGLSTLYAHLNDFYPTLEKWVEEQQYRLESWAVELTLTPKQFPVSKGQFIAYSGNTGGSQGPHLHFEIRDTKTEKCLNPLLFGFPVKDEVEPTLVRLAVYDREKSVYEQTPELYSLKRTDSGYILPRNAILKTGFNKLSFGIQAYDRLSGSTNPNGIYSARLFVHDQPGFGFELDSISYEETRYMNAHIDYRFRATGGAYIQHVSRLPGDNGVIYRNGKGDGIINLSGTSLVPVRIEVKDAHGNTSLINFGLQYSDSIYVSAPKNVPQEFSPGVVNIFENENFEAYLPEICLYDSMKTTYLTKNNGEAHAISAAHQFGDPDIPLHDDMTIRIKPVPVPASLKDKILIRQIGNRTRIRKGVFQKEWVMAKFEECGIFQAFIDTVPPVLNSLGRGDTVDLSPASRIIFQPSDNFGVIADFTARLDGRWLRFTNDKRRSFIYKFDERCPYGVHNLEVEIKDLAGNITRSSWIFERNPYTPPKKKPVSRKKTSKKKTSAKKR